MTVSLYWRRRPANRIRSEVRTAPTKAKAQPPKPQRLFDLSPFEAHPAALPPAPPVRPIDAAAPVHEEDANDRQAGGRACIVRRQGRHIGARPGGWRGRRHIDYDLP